MAPEILEHSQVSFVETDDCLVGHLANRLFLLLLGGPGGYYSEIGKNCDQSKVEKQHIASLKLQSTNLDIRHIANGVMHNHVDASHREFSFQITGQKLLGFFFSP